MPSLYLQVQLRMVKVDFVLFLVSLTACISWRSVQSLSWTRIEVPNGVAPPARRYSAMAWNQMGTALYVFGGEGSDGALGKFAVKGKSGGILL